MFLSFSKHTYYSVCKLVFTQGCIRNILKREFFRISGRYIPKCLIKFLETRQRNVKRTQYREMDPQWNESWDKIESNITELHVLFKYESVFNLFHNRFHTRSNLNIYFIKGNLNIYVFKRNSPSPAVSTTFTLTLTPTIYPLHKSNINFLTSMLPSEFPPLETVHQL